MNVDQVKREGAMILGKLSSTREGVGHVWGHIQTSIENGTNEMHSLLSVPGHVTMASLLIQVCPVHTFGSTRRYRAFTGVAKMVLTMVF